MLEKGCSVVFKRRVHMRKKKKSYMTKQDVDNIMKAAWEHFVVNDGKTPKKKKKKKKK